MVMNEKDLGLFDDPTYDDLARWVEECVDGGGRRCHSAGV